MEDQKQRIYTIVAIAALVAVLLGCIAGGLAGGVAGFLVGQRAGRSAAGRALDSALVELRQLPRMMPEILPEEPSPPELRPEEGVVPSVGVLILEVIPGTAAHEAGLKAGDVLMAIDRTPIDQSHALPDVIAQYRPGDRVTVRFSRAGQTESVILTLGRHPEEPDQAYLGIYFRETMRPPSERPQD